MFDTQSFEPEITIDIHPTAATDKATDPNLETIAQFRERLGLSEDAYSKLRKRAIRRWKELDWQPVRTGSNVNFVVNPDQLEQLHKEETAKASFPLAERSEIIQVSNVEILPPESQSTLQTLFNQTQELTPYKRSETHLNGSQALSIDVIKSIADRIDQMDRRNADARERLDQRREDNLLMEGMLSRLTEVGQSKELEARDLDDEARQLQIEETQLKKQIEALRSKLSV